MLDVLPYVMEDAVELEKAKISPAVGPEPSVALPLTLMSLRMPKYTFECEPRLTPEHVTVAPTGNTRSSRSPSRCRRPAACRWARR